MAHELLHSTKPLDKALSNVLLCSVGYMHWDLQPPRPSPQCEPCRCPGLM